MTLHRKGPEMNQALAWLNSLMQAIGQWIPRLVLIHPTHRAVLFGPRGGAKQRGPGLIWYWPITHALLKMPIAMRSMQMSGQILRCREQGHRSLLPYNCLCSAAIQYRIEDAVLAAITTLNTHVLVDNRMRAAIAEAWPGSLEIASQGQWKCRALIRARKELSVYGIYLERIDVVQLGYSVCNKSLGDYVVEEDPLGRQQGEN